MPTKATGSNMKIFNEKCMGKDHDLSELDNYLNREKVVVDTFLKGEELELPKVVSSHVWNDRMIKLIEQLPKSVLLIYMHREESQRFSSAIKQAYSRKDLRPGVCNIAFDAKDNTYITREDKLISNVKARTEEMGHGEADILTRDTFDPIKKNAPNMIFIHFNQVNKVQEIISKYHCPHMLEEGQVEFIASTTKEHTAQVRIGKNGHDVALEDRFSAKSDMVSFALNLRDATKSCQGTIKEMEEDLFECATELLSV